MNRPAVKTFVFAHQDDEILIAGKILREAAAGSDVRLIWVNDGSGGTNFFVSEEDKALSYAPFLLKGEPAGTLSESREKEILSIVREAESRTAMKSLGVPDDRMVFLKRSAERLKRPTDLAELIRDLARRLDGIGPEEIYCVAWEGAHFTHDIVNFAVARAARRMAKPPAGLFEFPQYPLLKSFHFSALKRFKGNKTADAAVHLLHYGVGAFADRKRGDVSIRLTPGEIEAKKALAAFYVSQKKLTQNFEKIIKIRLVLGLGLPWLRENPSVETWRPIPPRRNYRRPPAAGRRYSQYSQGVTDDDYRTLFTQTLDLLD